MTTNSQSLQQQTTLIAAVLMLTTLVVRFQTPAFAESVLYDNTDHTWRWPHSDGPKNILWVWFENDGSVGPETFILSHQPFQLGGHESISSVAISAGRDKNAPAEGSFQVELWDDNGSGLPGSEIAKLGAVDLASLDVVNDFPSPTSEWPSPNNLPTVELDRQVDGLTPGDTYHVVFRVTAGEIPCCGPVFANGLSNSAIGANGAKGAADSPVNPVLPLDDSDWIPLQRSFPHGQHLQMRVVSAEAPYEIASTTIGISYSQAFDSMHGSGQIGSVPVGWSNFDEVVENDVADPTDDEIIYNTFTTHAFPPDSRFRLQTEGPTLFNAGVPGESDRALAIGTHRRSGESTLQFVTELTGGDAQSLQLAFDVEA